MVARVVSHKTRLATIVDIEDRDMDFLLKCYEYIEIDDSIKEDIALQEYDKMNN